MVRHIANVANKTLERVTSYCPPPLFVGGKGAGQKNFQCWQKGRGLALFEFLGGGSE